MKNVQKVLIDFANLITVWAIRRMFLACKSAILHANYRRETRI